MRRYEAQNFNALVEQHCDCDDFFSGLFRACILVAENVGIVRLPFFGDVRIIEKGADDLLKFGMISNPKDDKVCQRSVKTSHEGSNENQPL